MAVPAMSEEVIYGRPGDYADDHCLTCGREFRRKIPHTGAMLKRDEDCDDCAEAFQAAFNSTRDLKMAAGDGNVH
jgi:hypothetical protein